MVLLRASVSFLAAAFWAVPVLCGAAERTPLPAETPSHQTVPEAGGSSTEPLSKKLDRQGGVIRPPSGIDPGIAQRPPAEGTTPVIPPPGTPGGEKDIKPK